MSDQVPKGFFESTAHEWCQKLPLINKVLVCMRCNHEAPIGNLGDVRCAPHFESDKSGFIS